MSTKLKAGTATSGAVIDADTAGILELQSGSTPTTGLTVNAVQGVSVNNCLAVGNAIPSTSGAGITFPATQSASTDANTLDDYEEGTFTPTLLGSSGTVGSYANQSGKYTKIGNSVTVWAYVQLTSTGTLGGQISVGGLPFTVASALYTKASVRVNGITALGTNGNGSASGYTGGGGTSFFIEYGTNVGMTGLTSANITNSTDIMIQLTYPAA